MRISQCYALVKAGFFLGASFYSRRRRFSGNRTPSSLNQFWVRRLPQLWDGLGSKGLLTSRTVQARNTEAGPGRLRGIAQFLFFFFVPNLNPSLVWAWAALRYIRARSYRGKRYKLGLPANGQRTRSNARTVRRVKDAACFLLKTQTGVARLWQPIKRPQRQAKTRMKSISKRALKAEKYKRGVVRTKKKRDAWR